MNVFGWVGEASNDSSVELPDLYLRDVATVSADGARRPLDYTTGLFIPGKTIRWIQLLAPESSAGSETSSEPMPS
jgi:hypothetical protein